MTLVNQVRDQISRYLREDISLIQLRNWFSMADNVQAIADSSDPSVHDLSDRVLMLVSELDYGHRTEPELRKLLREALNRVLT